VFEPPAFGPFAQNAQFSNFKAEINDADKLLGKRHAHSPMEPGSSLVLPSLGFLKRPESQHDSTLMCETAEYESLWHLPRSSAPSRKGSEVETGFATPASCQTPSTPEGEDGALLDSFHRKLENLSGNYSYEQLYEECMKKELARPAIPTQPNPAHFFPEGRQEPCKYCHRSGTDPQHITCSRCDGKGFIRMGRQHKDAERERRAWHKFFQDYLHYQLPDQLLKDCGIDQNLSNTKHPVLDKQKVLEASVLYVRKLNDLATLQHSIILSGMFPGHPITTPLRHNTQFVKTCVAA